MATFLLKRLGLMVLTLWILSVIVFFAGEVQLFRQLLAGPGTGEDNVNITPHREPR